LFSLLPILNKVRPLIELLKEGIMSAQTYSFHNKGNRDMIPFDIEKSGIYKITNTINNKVYYGSAKCFRDRWWVHRNDLRSNNHDNKHLQAAWNKYGESVFLFEIVIYVPISCLLGIEQVYLDKYWDDCINCYNITKNAVAPMLGRNHTEETKKLMSIAQIGKKRDKPMSEEARKNMSKARMGNKNRLGSSPSEYTRKLLSIKHIGKNCGEKSGCAKLTNEQVVTIRSCFKQWKTNGLTQKEIGIMFNVSNVAISRIINNK